MQLQWASDDGEPQGTSGAPMVKLLTSEEITDTVIVVTRYFGGIKLGTSGLIAAYRQGARLAIEAASIESRSEMGSLTFTFPYMAMNDVMKVVKSAGLQILSQQFDNTCSMSVVLPTDNLPSISRRIADIDGVSLCE